MEKTMDLEKTRFNMIEQQIRPWDVLDDSVLNLLQRVKITPELSQAAAQKLAAHGFNNVTLDVGDAARGWHKHAPYDVIVVTGSLPVLPDEFIAQLNPGVRLLAFVGVAPAMEAQLIRVIEPGVTDAQVLFETDVRALKNAPPLE